MPSNKQTAYSLETVPDTFSCPAVLTSLIASCKNNFVEPWAWLKDVLTKMPNKPQLQELMPDKWLNVNPEMRWDIADRRKNERKGM